MDLPKVSSSESNHKKTFRSRPGNNSTFISDKLYMNVGRLERNGFNNTANGPNFRATSE